MPQTHELTREVATRYIDLLCEQKFAEAFGLLADDVSYRIIGTTPASAPMRGRQTVIDTLVGVLGACQQPPKLTRSEVLVDGNRAVCLASGRGVGPTGIPYLQEHYAMVLRIDDHGVIVDVVEFADTVAVEVALCGKKLVAA